MPTRIAHQLAGWHPIILTAVLLAGLVAQLGASGLTLSPLARGVFTAAPLVVMCVWQWSVFHVSRRISVRASSGYRDWLYALPPAIALVAGTAGWSTNNSPAAFAVFVSLFVGIIQAARTLENVDAANGNASAGRMLATVLLMYLAPFGLWILHPKILRVAARSEAMSPA